MTQSSTMTGDILIVDDNPENLKTLQDILTQEEYQVRGAINGDLALDSVALKYRTRSSWISACPEWTDTRFAVVLKQILF